MKQNYNKLKDFSLIPFLGVGILLLSIYVYSLDIVQKKLSLLRYEYRLYQCLENKDVKACDAAYCDVSIRKITVMDEKDFIGVQDILCQNGDLEFCVEASKLFKRREKHDDLIRKNLHFACKDGTGGNYEACGLYADYLEKDGDSVKANQFRKRACELGYNQFCLDG